MAIAPERLLPLWMDSFKAATNAFTGSRFVESAIIDSERSMGIPDFKRCDRFFGNLQKVSGPQSMGTTSEKTRSGMVMIQPSNKNHPPGLQINEKGFPIPCLHRIDNATPLGIHCFKKISLHQRVTLKTSS